VKETSSHVRLAPNGRLPVEQSKQRYAYSKMPIMIEMIGGDDHQYIAAETKNAIIYLGGDSISRAPPVVRGFASMRTRLKFRAFLEIGSPLW
jgi:hypothetical protein